MASIANDPGGRKRVLVLCVDGRRRPIRLGKCDRRSAETVRMFIEKIAAANANGSAFDDATSAWVGSISEALHAKISSIGLVKPRNAGRAVLGTFVDAYVAGRSDVKPRTLTNLRQVRSWLVDCFGETKDMRSIGACDAEDWRLFMIREGLGENTIRRHVGRARQLWKAAIRRGLVHGVNPFEGMAATVRADTTRQFFVPRETVEKIIDACTDLEWKLIVVLSRYGGLRCPSETLSLKWSDVNWEQSVIRVPSPKTAHHDGGDHRFIPLFPELRRHLLAAFEAAADGNEFVITRYRQQSSNLRTQLERICVKAGVEPWLKLFHNMRSTRQTELSETYPEHVVCAWLGNSSRVARKHYLQLTDAHFEKAAQNPAQPAQDRRGQGPSTNRRNDENSLTCQPVAAGGNAGQEGHYPRQDSNL